MRRISWGVVITPVLDVFEVDPGEPHTACTVPDKLRNAIARDSGRHPPPTRLIHDRDPLDRESPLDERTPLTGTPGWAHPPRRWRSGHTGREEVVVRGVPDIGVAELDRTEDAAAPWKRDEARRRRPCPLFVVEDRRHVAPVASSKMPLALFWLFCVLATVRSTSRSRSDLPVPLNSMAARSTESSGLKSNGAPLSLWIFRMSNAVPRTSPSESMT